MSTHTFTNTNPTGAEGISAASAENKGQTTYGMDIDQVGVIQFDIDSNYDCWATEQGSFAVFCAAQANIKGKNHG